MRCWHSLMPGSWQQPLCCFPTSTRSSINLCLKAAVLSSVSVCALNRLGHTLCLERAAPSRVIPLICVHVSAYCSCPLLILGIPTCVLLEMTLWGQYKESRGTGSSQQGVLAGAEVSKGMEQGAVSVGRAGLQGAAQPHVQCGRGRSCFLCPWVGRRDVGC